MWENEWDYIQRFRPRNLNTQFKVQDQDQFFTLSNQELKVDLMQCVFMTVCNSI